MEKTEIQINGINPGKRVALFDNVKFFLILTVVIGHLAEVGASEAYGCQIIFLIIYAFHMPLFIFLSGVFNKYKNVTEKVMSFVLLGFALKVVLSASRMIIRGKTSFSLLSGGGLPWFCFVLAGYFLLSYFLRKTDKRVVLVISILVACFVGYDKTIGDYMNLSRLVVFYPFFVLGEMTKEETLLNLNKNKILKAAAVCVIALWVFICFTNYESVSVLRPLFTGKNSFHINEALKQNGILYRLCSYIITFMVSLSVLLVIPDIRLPFITKAGSRTFQVYFWHMPIIFLLQKCGVYKYLFSGGYTGKIIWLLLGVVITVILSLKPFGYFTDKVLKGSKEHEAKKIF